MFHYPPWPIHRHSCHYCRLLFYYWQGPSLCQSPSSRAGPGRSSSSTPPVLTARTPSRPCHCGTGRSPACPWTMRGTEWVPRVRISEQLLPSCPKYPKLSYFWIIWNKWLNVIIAVRQDQSICFTICGTEILIVFQTADYYSNQLSFLFSRFRDLCLHFYFLLMVTFFLEDSYE